jgi:hypothetical protein
MFVSIFFAFALHFMGLSAYPVPTISALHSADEGGTAPGASTAQHRGVRVDDEGGTAPG